MVDPQDEAQNLAQAYLDEDPSILTDAELISIGEHYGMSLAEMKATAKAMSEHRNAIDPDELQ